MRRTHLQVKPLSEETSRIAYSAALRRSISFPLFQGTGLQSSNPRRSLIKSYSRCCAESAIGNENTNAAALEVSGPPTLCSVCTNIEEVSDMTLGCRLKDMRARSSMNIQSIESNKCVRRGPTCRITNLPQGDTSCQSH
jgi:hypothetical protein